MPVGLQCVKIVIHVVVDVFLLLHKLYFSFLSLAYVSVFKCIVVRFVINVISKHVAPP
jgi:hypothetical protein